MSHIVKCAICSKQFDIQKQITVRYGKKRYAHQSCFPEGQIIEIQGKDKSDRTKLHDYIKSLYGSCNWPRLVKEQNKLIQNGYTLVGIFGALYWFYSIEQNPVQTEYADTIMDLVPYIYKRAQAYYKKINDAEKINMGKDIKDYVSPTTYKIYSPKRKVDCKLFNLEDE